jgi:hypothetical protein
MIPKSRKSVRPPHLNMLRIEVGPLSETVWRLG